MEILTSTKFRANLASVMKRALMGIDVRIQTKEGAVRLVPVEEEEVRDENERNAPLRPKIKGAIVGDLEDANFLLREHLRLPDDAGGENGELEEIG
jgi:antitoxin (DNA-binding transcriptional repressor) of toxin-antitoxin stability system